MISDCRSVMVSFRSSPSNESFTSAFDMVADVPMPSASMTRKTTSKPTVSDTQEPTEPTVNRMQPARNVRLRPNRSEIGPEKNMAMVDASKKANMVEFSSAGVTPSSTCIVGKAGAYMSMARI